MPTPRVRTVAVIDDDRRVLKSLANLLASSGYGTRACESPLDFSSDGHSGLVCVITDLGMRPIDGIQVLDRTVHSWRGATLPSIVGDSEILKLAWGGQAILCTCSDGSAWPLEAVPESEPFWSRYFRLHGWSSV